MTRTLQPQWAQNALITSLWRQNDVVTSFWCNNDIIIGMATYAPAPCADGLSGTVVMAMKKEPPQSHHNIALHFKRSIIAINCDVIANWKREKFYLYALILWRHRKLEEGTTLYMLCYYDVIANLRREPLFYFYALVLWRHRKLEEGTTLFIWSHSTPTV